LTCGNDTYAYYLTVANTTDNWIFKSASPTAQRIIIFRVQGAVRSISTLTQPTSPVVPGGTATVSVTLDGSLSTGQAVWLRYSATSNFSSSSCVQMTGSGTSYSASIPASSNTAGSTVYYYAFTSGDGASIAGSDADLYTINLMNNSGSNYSYTVASNFYSKATGDLQNLSNWGTSTDGSGTAPANFTSNGVTYNIRNNATPTIGASWTVSGTGSKIVVGDGSTACTFTIPSGFSYSSTATDISANATVRNQNTGVTSLGTCTVTGTYEHNADGGTIPTATWATNSTCNITGSTGTTDLSGLAQSFFNFTYNCSGGSEFINTSSFSVSNTFSMPSTNAGTITMGNSSVSYTISIKDFNLAGGMFTLAGSSSSGGAVQTLNITNDLNISGGTLDISRSSTGTGAVTVTRNFTHTAGAIQKTDGTASITLNGTTGTQTLESTGQTSLTTTISFSVAGSNAQCVIASGKTFVIGAGTSFTVGNGTSAPDLLVTGTLTNGRTIAHTVTGTITIDGTYNHTAADGGIPTATWGTNSLCNITGPTASADLSGLGQSFYNFTYNCSGGQEPVPLP
jgi:hypothetical protein